MFNVSAMSCKHKFHDGFYDYGMYSTHIVPHTSSFVGRMFVQTTDVRYDIFNFLQVLSVSLHLSNLEIQPDTNVVFGNSFYSRLAPHFSLRLGAQAYNRN